MMKDKDLDAFNEWRNGTSTRLDIHDAWQAACEFKDMQLINGSKMKQMNDRIEELIDENKKLRKIIHDLVITGMDSDMAERLEEIDEE